MFLESIPQWVLLTAGRLPIRWELHLFSTRRTDQGSPDVDANISRPRSTGDSRSSSSALGAALVESHTLTQTPQDLRRLWTGKLYQRPSYAVLETI